MEVARTMKGGGEKKHMERRRALKGTKTVELGSNRFIVIGHEDVSPRDPHIPPIFLPSIESILWSQSIQAYNLQSTFIVQWESTSRYTASGNNSPARSLYWPTQKETMLL